MIFTCPGGHKTFLGEPAGQRALPIIGAGELRHCLTCNAERRFEWKPEPLKYPEIDLPIEEVVATPEQILAASNAFTSVERSSDTRRLSQMPAHVVTDDDLAEAFAPYGGVEAFEAALRADKQWRLRSATKPIGSAPGCTDGHDWVPFKAHVGHPPYLHQNAHLYEMCSRQYCHADRRKREPK